MKLRTFFNGLILFLFILITNASFSQINTFYYYGGGGSNSFNEFRYNNQYYDKSPKGLQTFLSETEMSENLRNDLTSQLKTIKKKKIISFSGMLLATAGFVITANEILTSDKENTERSSTAFIGMGMFCSGIAVNLLTSPSKKKYLDFINTFNKENKDIPIIITLKVDYVRQTNLGLVMSF
jgi:hypothetical protein